MVCQVRSTLSARKAAKLSAVVLAVAAASSAMAADNGQQRYAPGVGGSDMTSALVPGTYIQTPMVSYHASKLKDGAGRDATGSQPVDLGPLGVQNVDYNTKFKTSIQAIQARVTHLTGEKFLGAKVGVTAMVPLIKSDIDLAAGNPTINPAVPEPYASAATAGVAAGVASASSSSFGIGDLEISPLLHWELAENQSLLVAPTIVLPTGQYDASERANPGYGNFYSFRPSVQYAYIGDGWDVGARFVMLFNTRNKDSGYRTGNIFNMDWQAMKFVSDDVRMGLQGYFVRQLTGDTLDATVNPTIAATKQIVNGNKMRVNGVGPAVAWVVNGGDMLIEGKYLKEFGARNRSEGESFWLSISKPL